MHGLVRQNFFTFDCREYRNDVNAAILDFMPPKINETVHCKKLKPHHFPRSSLEGVVMPIQKWIYFGLSLEFVCFILCFVL
jgi:hypothetical protein